MEKMEPKHLTATKARQDNCLLFGLFHNVLNSLFEFIDSRADLFSVDTLDSLSEFMSNVLVDFNDTDKVYMNLEEEEEKVKSINNLIKSKTNGSN